jgi:hypothetical protein
MYRRVRCTRRDEAPERSRHHEPVSEESRRAADQQRALFRLIPGRGPGADAAHVAHVHLALRRRADLVDELAAFQRPILQANGEPVFLLPVRRNAQEVARAAAAARRGGCHGHARRALEGLGAGKSALELGRQRLLQLADRIDSHDPPSWLFWHLNRAVGESDDTSPNACCPQPTLQSQKSRRSVNILVTCVLHKKRPTTRTS